MKRKFLTLPPPLTRQSAASPLTLKPEDQSPLLSLTPTLLIHQQAPGVLPLCRLQSLALPSPPLPLMSPCHPLPNDSPPYVSVGLPCLSPPSIWLPIGTFQKQTLEHWATDCLFSYYPQGFHTSPLSTVQALGSVKGSRFTSHWSPSATTRGISSNPPVHGLCLKASPRVIKWALLSLQAFQNCSLLCVPPDLLSAELSPSSPPTISNTNL